MQIIIWKKEIMISSRGWIIPFCDHVLPIGFILPFPQPTPSPLHNAAVVCNFFAKMPKFWTLTLGNTPMPRHPFLFWYTKKEKYLHDISIFTFRKKNSQAYLIWAPKLDEPPLSKIDLKYSLHEIPTLERDWSSVKHIIYLDFQQQLRFYQLL